MMGGFTRRCINASKSTPLNHLWVLTSYKLSNQKNRESKNREIGEISESRGGTEENKRKGDTEEK